MEIKGTPVDLDNTLLELETGLVRVINNEGPSWRIDTDLAKEAALLDSGIEIPEPNPTSTTPVALATS